MKRPDRKRKRLDMAHPTPVPIVALRRLASAQRHRKIFEFADALAVGQSFVLVNDHDPKPWHDQPEPMIRTPAMTERMRPGEILSVLPNRRPAFLPPKLDRRGHHWRGGFEDGGKACRPSASIRERGGETQ
jgi:hypothetical protein